MSGFFSTVIDLITTSRADKKYKELQANPEEAQQSDYFGKKFIGCAVGAIVYAAVAVVFGAICLILRRRETDLLSGLLFFVYIVCFAAAILLALYAIIYLLSRLKFIKWQRKLNDLPIGKKAKRMSWIALLLTVVLDIGAILLTLLSVAG